jgi:hypothetical protein
MGFNSAFKGLIGIVWKDTHCVPVVNMASVAGQLPAYDGNS